MKPPDYFESSTLPNLKIRPDLPIDTVMIDMLRLASDAATLLNITMFVGGAMARDLILRHVFGQQVGRATRDVDLGVLVNSWDDFANLKSQLIATQKFSEQPGSFQRLYYEHSYPLDLLPFGPIARSDRTIAWPPEHNPVMSVLGFAEAQRASLPIELTPGFSVQVASLPSLALMKLIAWIGRNKSGMPAIYC
jgi:predicted nucleotidyltransferase